jgi:2-polyprenyl-3-methyl-5-hydroxy-6-metoxy-1,4-benzoquinol methylase
MKTQDLSSEYLYQSTHPSCTNAYLWGHVQKTLQASLPAGSRVFELGCGNGATASSMARLGYSVTAIDPSSSGIQIASQAHPEVTFAERSAYDDLAGEFGTFPAVVSLEVVEHVMWPRKFADTVFTLLEPGGFAVISTPFHSYVKNLAIALSGTFDSHWSPLWDGGHIKFWSEKTLGILLRERGFADIRFIRAGRIPLLAKSMIAVARKPRD